MGMNLLGTNWAAGSGWARAAAASFLLLRRSVARSGLLAVPGERYMERRFVWSSVSSWAS